MREHLVFTGGAAWRLTEDEDHDIMDWLRERYGAETKASVVCLSVQDVLARLGASVLPPDFPAADVVIGQSGRGMRGWLDITVAAWEAAQAAAATAMPDVEPEPEPAEGGDGAQAVSPEPAAPAAPAPAAVRGPATLIERSWSVRSRASPSTDIKG